MTASWGAQETTAVLLCIFNIKMELCINKIHVDLTLPTLCFLEFAARQNISALLFVYLSLLTY